MLDAEDTIETTLAALCGQLVPEWVSVEVIVSDDGSTDATVDLASCSSPLVRVVTTVDSSRTGPGAARNRGVAASSGDVVVFLDSDDRPRPDWVAQISRAFSDSEVGIATWPAVIHDASSARCMTRRPDRRDPNHVLGLQGCFGLLRTVFDAAGGYDPELRFGENTDLCDRAVASCLARNLRVQQCDDVTVEITFNQPSSHYDRKRLDAALHLLQRDSDALATDAGRRGGLLNVATVNAARCGEWPLARRCAIQALRAQPLHWRPYMRLGAVLVPVVTRKLWSSDVERPRF